MKSIYFHNESSQRPKQNKVKLNQHVKIPKENYEN